MADSGRRRIVIIGPTWPYRGGIAHHTTMLSRFLQEENDVALISYKRQYPGWLYPGETDKDGSKSYLEGNNVEYIIDSLNPATWLKAAKRIIAIKPDAIIIQWWVVFWVPAYWSIIQLVKRKCQAPITFICHNVIEHESNQIKYLLSRSLLKLGSRFIVHADSEKDKLRNMFGDCEIIKSFLPSFEDLKFEEIEAGQARREIGLNEHDETLLFFGFVRQYKGLAVILEALPEILASRPGAKLMIVGEFWKDKKEYLAIIQKLGIAGSVIIIDKYVPNEDIGRYFAASDLVVQPYLSATGSGICQLAYGFGKPVIATRVGSLDEVIECGSNGQLVEPGNSRELARAILKSLDRDTLKQLHENAAHTKDKFSWGNYIRNF
jgi:glycosyltransferase involved in cell wall biosynthesis